MATLVEATGSGGRFPGKGFSLACDPVAGGSGIGAGGGTHLPNLVILSIVPRHGILAYPSGS